MRGSIPLDFKNSESPIPDNCNNWGVLNAPPERITSPAFTVWSLPLRLNVTPVAFLPSKCILVTNARVLTVKFLRFIAGRK